jgi:hypothetical protein
MVKPHPKGAYMKALRYGLFIGLLMTGVMMQGKAFAISFGDEGNLEVTGKIQSRISLRTGNTDGFTFPEVARGNMVQQRNLATIELNHVLSQQTATMPEFKYHVKGRFLYEGVYDYGPEAFRDVREANPDVIDDFKHDEDLWEFYADYLKGPWFFRVGKQNLSWGETDIYQLLDRINPLDNTFGGAFEDLDDRRIPIWMARGMYNFGNIGPISSLTLEGFWNPGHAGQEVAPFAPYGSPYAYPSPPPTVPVRLHEPEDTFQNSRAGVRIQGVIDDNFNVALAHYQTIMDTPSAVVTIDPSVPGMVAQDLTYETVQVTGASMNFYEGHLNTVFRTEVAWFWDEPVFIPEINAPALFGNFVTGEIPKTNVLRYMVGFDKNFWFRLINRKSMINMYFQYFAEYYTNYDERQKLPVNRFPFGEFMDQERYEDKYTLVTSTTYMDGTLTPQVALVYDPEGALMYIPSIEKSFHPWIFKLAYYGITGHDDVSVGILRDRQQVSFQATLVF